MESVKGLMIFILNIQAGNKNPPAKEVVYETGDFHSAVNSDVGCVDSSYFLSNPFVSELESVSVRNGYLSRIK